MRDRRAVDEQDVRFQPGGYGWIIDVNRPREISNAIPGYKPGINRRTSKSNGRNRVRGKIQRMIVIGFLLIWIGSGSSSAQYPARPIHGKSDKWISWRVDALLKNNTRYDYRNVEVTAKNGVVTLKGSVLTPYEKFHAGLVAEDVPRVSSVVNDIVAAKSLNQDMAMAQRVRSEILLEPALKILSLDVVSKQGKVELYGIVSTSDQKLYAGRFVGEIPGVKKVVNEILVE
jgi:osmotically-inducible protein OsmY